MRCPMKISLLLLEGEESLVWCAFAAPLGQQGDFLQPQWKYLKDCDCTNGCTSLSTFTQVGWSDAYHLTEAAVEHGDWISMEILSDDAVNIEYKVPNIACSLYASIAIGCHLIKNEPLLRKNSLINSNYLQALKNPTVIHRTVTEELAFMLLILLLIWFISFEKSST